MSYFCHLAVFPASFYEAAACHIRSVSVRLQRENLIFIPLQLTSSSFMLQLVCFYASFDAGDEKVESVNASQLENTPSAHSCARIMIPSAAKWCVYLSSRHSIRPPSERRELCNQAVVLILRPR